MSSAKQKSVWGIALKAGTIQTTQVFSSRQEAEDAIDKISHLSNGFEAVELGPVNSPELPDGWTNNGLADSALVMLDRLDTLDPDDDVRIEEVKRIVRQLAITMQPQNEPQNIPNNIPVSCKWTYDEHDYKWDSACGEAWQITDGGPEDNHVRFCQGCGKSVLLPPTTEK